MSLARRHLAMLGLALASACSASTSEPGPTTGTSSPPTPGACNASAAADVEVASDDLNGFPPYVVAACTLVYVSRSGELVSRDLSTGAETTLAPAGERPRRPAASNELVAWEADEDGHSVVRVRARGADTTHAITGAFVAAGEPRASGATVAFTAWLTPAPAGDSDVWLYEATTGEAHVVLGGPGQQRFADISSAYVAVTDFSEDPDGRYDGDGTDLADIVVLDRTTRAVTRRRLPGKQSFPMLADGNVLAYLEWNGIHPEPKLTAYTLRSGAVVGDPAADTTIAQVTYVSSDYARPAVAGPSS